MPIADKDHKAILKRLKSLLDDNDQSIRGLCEKTQSLGIHEQMYHPNLSEIFRSTGRYNLSLQQFIVILKLLGTNPKRFFLKTDQASEVADAFNRIDDNEKDEIIDLMVSFLEKKPGSKAIIRRLSSVREIDASD